MTNWLYKLYFPIELCSVPCKNGGECTDVDTCTCSSPAFYGRYCEKGKLRDTFWSAIRNKLIFDSYSISSIISIIKSLMPVLFINIDFYLGIARRYFTCVICFCPTDSCIPPCENGGACTAFRTCDCPDGYQGNICQIRK